MKDRLEEFSDIQQRLSKLRPEAPRDETAAKAGRERFLATVRSMHPPAEALDHQPAGRRGWRWSLGRALAALLLALLATGTGIGFAAQSALPADNLFETKLGIERLRLALAPSEIAAASVRLEFLERRAEEIQSLAIRGRQEDLAVAVGLYRQYLLAASELIFNYQERGEANGEDLLAQLISLLSEQQAFFLALIEDYPELAETDLRLLFGLVDSLNESGTLREEGLPRAQLFGLNPSLGKQGETINVTIQGEGTHFTDDSLVYFEPDAGLRVQTVHAFNGAQLFVRIYVADDAPLGEVSVWVQSGDEIARGIHLTIQAAESDEDEDNPEEEATPEDQELEESGEDHDEDQAEFEEETEQEHEDYNGSGSEHEDESTDDGDGDEHGEEDDEHDDGDEEHSDHGAISTRFHG